MTGRHAHTHNAQCMCSHTDAHVHRREKTEKLLLDLDAKYKPSLKLQMLTSLGKALCLNHLPSKSPSLVGEKSQGLP